MSRERTLFSLKSHYSSPIISRVKRSKEHAIPVCGREPRESRINFFLAFAPVVKIVARRPIQIGDKAAVLATRCAN